MYLKRLEMHGFKSFAKKADLSFTQNITMVVGPNGSGKSNIVDAIRWVLGEGSAKSLRGSKMEDVIFAGSTDKKPLGMAQVSLTLDNSTGIFPIDYTEIKITRKIYRSGESEYLINNTRCRLKDIHELIMDTGIGRDSFAIIGQGKVDQILLSQADEKRMLIEEVAGVSKYRYRKNEAKRKLADTEQSLCRVRDIIAELSSREEPLREQSYKAKAYKTIKGELDQLEVKTSQYMISSFQEKADASALVLESLKKSFLAADTEIQTAEASGAETSVAMDRLIREISEGQNVIFSAENSISDHKAKIELAATMLETYKENLQKTHQEITALSQEKATLAGQKESAEKQYVQIRQEYEQALDLIKKEEEAIAEIRKTGAEQDSVVLEYRDQIFDHVQQMSSKKNQLIDADKQMAVLQAGIDAASAKEIQYQQKIAELDLQKDRVSKEKTAVLGIIQKIQAQQMDLQRLLEDEEAKKEDLEKDLRQAEQRQTSLEAEKKALENLEENREGYYAGVRHVSANQSLRGIIGTVADVISADPLYITALETALGAGIQHIITKDEESAKAAIRFLYEQKKGRATFLPLSTIAQRLGNKTMADSNSLQRAAEVVTCLPEYQPVVEYLLGNIYIAKTLEQAVAINKKLKHPVRIVTLRGDLLDPRGAITGGAHKKQQTGLLQRKEKIQILMAQVIETQTNIAALTADLLEIEQGMAQRRQEHHHLQQELLTHQESLQQTDNKLQQLIFQEQEINNDLLYLSAESETMRKNYLELQIQKQELDQTLLVLEQKKHNLEAGLSQNQEKTEQEKLRLYDLEKQLGRKQIHGNDLKNKKENKKAQYEALILRLEELTEKINQLTEEEKKLVEKIAGFEKDIVFHNDAIQNQSLDLHQLKNKLEEKIQQRDQFDTLKKENDTMIREKRREAEVLREKLHREEIQTEKYKTEARAYIETLEERFGITWQGVLPGIFEDFNERKARSRIRELKRETELLGEVNLTAISEYEKLMERNTFLKEQSGDLEKAQEALHQIIIEMDQIIIKKFKDTYAKLNESFKETFREMFSGGHAEIIMTDKDNVLETGIEIIAQPPGKTPKHLSLLSGGEKAMTAICLLFAIIKIKPGPFCILDEIEASLDEANVNRFARFLKTFAELTQFIVISHRKGTMEAADVLYGVTMEDKGVSNLISVRISETIKLSG